MSSRGAPGIVIETVRPCLGKTELVPGHRVPVSDCKLNETWLSPSLWREELSSCVVDQVTVMVTLRNNSA